MGLLLGGRKSRGSESETRRHHYEPGRDEEVNLATVTKEEGFASLTLHRVSSSSVVPYAPGRHRRRLLHGRGRGSLTGDL